MFRWIEEYYKHSALNVGQALQGIRYFYSHPDADEVAARGSLRHFTCSLGIRAKAITNDLFFAAIPPHWHHTPEELANMCKISATRWFRYGYCAWRFEENGESRADISNVDRRWDPRCRKPAP